MCELFDGGPDALDVVVIFEGLEELADLGAGVVVQLGMGFGEIADFGGDNGPSVLGEPRGDSVDGGALGDEAGAGAVGGDVVVLIVGERFEVVGAGFDGGGFAVDVEIGVVGFDEADVIEEELVAAGGAEDALLEKHADFGSGALVVVGVNFDDHGDFVRRVTLEDDVLHGAFVAAGAGALGDGAFDDVTGDARFFRFFDGGEESGVGADIGTAELGGDGHFFDEFSDHLPLLQVYDGAFCVKPLASHRSGRSWRIGGRGAMAKAEAAGAIFCRFVQLRAGERCDGSSRNASRAALNQPNHSRGIPMKRIRFFSILAAVALAATGVRAADPGYVDLGKFTPAKGREFVEVNLHAPLIKLAARFVDKDEPEVAELLRGLKHVRVNVVGFDETNKRETTDRVDAIRSELEGQGWVKLVTVKEAEQAADVGVYVKMREDESIDGVVVTVIDRSDDKAVFVNVVGNITPEQISALGEGLNIEPLAKLSLKGRKKSV